MTEGPLDTAHEKWDDYWRKDARRSQWSTPEPDVVAMLPALRAGSSVSETDRLVYFNTSSVASTDELGHRPDAP